MREEYVGADANGVRRPFFNRSVSWSAIIAGLVVALVIQALLTMLGVAIGAATVAPMQERNPVEGLGVGAGIWWFVTGLVSLFVGAFVAGRLQGVASKKEGRLHGFLMWGTATVFTFMVAGTLMGGMFASGFSAISDPGNREQLMSQFDEKTDQMGIGEQGRADMEKTDYDEVNRKGSDVDYNRTSPSSAYHSPTNTDQVNRIDGRASGEDQYSSGNAGVQETDRVGNNANPVRQDNEQFGTASRSQASDTAAAGYMDRNNDQAGGGGNTDANNRVVAGSQQEAAVREAGEEVANTASKAALMGLLVLLIGAGVCTWAGSKGAPHDFVPLHEHDARVPTGAMPGPLKG